MRKKYVYKTLDGLETIPLTKKEAGLIQLVARLFLAGTLIIGGGAIYKEQIKKHGSLNNAYDSLMKQSEKCPAKMFNVNY